MKEAKKHRAKCRPDGYPDGEAVNMDYPARYYCGAVTASETAFQQR